MLHVTFMFDEKSGRVTAPRTFCAGSKYETVSIFTLTHFCLIPSITSSDGLIDSDEFLFTGAIQMRENPKLAERWSNLDIQTIRSFGDFLSIEGSDFTPSDFVDSGKTPLSPVSRPQNVHILVIRSRSEAPNVIEHLSITDFRREKSGRLSANSNRDVLSNF